jgi:WD40 repeat protein
VIYPKKIGLILLDLKTGKETRRFAFDGKYTFYPAYSPDGKHVAAGVSPRVGDHHWIQCWDVATGKSLGVFKGRNGDITSLVFSPDGKYILTGHADKAARLWRVKK